MLHSHTGFEPYAKEWTTFADEPPQRLVEPLQKPLSHAWLAWTLLRLCNTLSCMLCSFDPSVY